MVDPDYLKFDTLSLHAGQEPDPVTGARAVPIYQTTSYSFVDTEQAAGLFNLEQPGHIYSRISNPTVAVLEERIAALEGGVGAVCTASGMAAFHLAAATIMSAGNHVVASRNIYGGTHNMLNLTMPRFGITTTFVDPRDPEAWRAAITADTRVLFAETLGNPGIEVLDVPLVAEIAHEHGLPLMVDATFTTPYLMKPIDLGADIVMHSVTKFLGGHGIALGGVIVDGGRFDWAANEKFPTLSQPYDGYHGITFAEEYGHQALSMRARAEVGLATASKVAITIPVVTIDGPPKAADHVADQGIPAVELPKRSTSPIASPLAVTVVADVLVAGWMLVMIDVSVRAFRENHHAEVGLVSGERAAIDPFPISDVLGVDEIVRAFLPLACGHPVLVPIVGRERSLLPHVREDDRVLRVTVELALQSLEGVAGDTAHDDQREADPHDQAQASFHDRFPPQTLERHNAIV